MKILIVFCVCLFSHFSFSVWTNPLDLQAKNENKSLLSIGTEKNLIDIIDKILNFGSVPKCATGQGQSGYCTVGSCSNLGNYSSVRCKGMNRFIKCCPNEKAVERYPLAIPECGMRPKRRGDLIVGGEEAIPFSWPWAAALYRVVNNQRFFQCGATIINDKYILTAAHCVYQSTEIIDASSYIVQVGAHDLTQSGDFIELEDIIIHENYTPQYHNDDIALLQLKKKLDFTNNNRIGPVCLPERGSQLGRRVGTMATMIGWGIHDPMNFSPSKTLYQVNVPIYSLDKCREIYSNLLDTNYYFSWNNIICAAYKNGGKDTCQGDSGGPMLFPQSNGRYYQVGIVSFGYGCAEKGYPGVYTYIPNYLNWIGAHISLH